MSDDLIKKEEAKEAVCKGCLKDWKICHHHWDCPMLTNLEMLPTADRPQGKWIFDPEILCSDIGVYSAGYRCSVCGKDYFKVEGINYCPNCGTDMRGVCR